MIPELSRKNYLVPFYRRHAADTFLSAFIFFSTFILLAWNFKSLGFYADDSAFFYALGNSNFSETFKEFLNYVPGRNFHMIWQKLVFLIVGWAPQSLPWMHLFQSAAESLVSVLFYFILRRFNIRYFPAFVGALLFALWPTRTDVHFWISSLPMNIFSTAFFLLFIFTTQSILKKAVGENRFFPTKLLLWDTAFFVFALFTYDQVFFAIFFILFARFIFIFHKKSRLLYRPLSIQFIIMLLVVFGYLYYKTQYSANAAGPVFSNESLQRIYPNLQYSIKLNFTHLAAVNLDPVSVEKITDGQAGLVYASYTAMLVFLLILLPKILKEKETSSTGVKKNLALLLFSVILFFLSYLPIYIWYIAPRHNYLPTVFIGAAVALVVSIIMTLLKKNKVLLVIFCAIIVLWPLRIAFFAFEENILKNSNVWASSFSIRKNMYSELIDKKIFTADKKCVFIKDAPAMNGGAPLFACEQMQIALTYLANIPPKNSPKECVNFISAEGDCYKVIDASRVNANKTLALRIDPFDPKKDSKLTYSIMDECKR